MADMPQAQARQAAIAKGANAAEVDKFIAEQGGARTSAQRITSAFDVAGSVGTNDLSAFHAQKATPAGADASAKGTYLSGATSAADNAMAGLAGAGGPPAGPGGTFPGGSLSGPGGAGSPGGATVASDAPDTSSEALKGLTGAIGMQGGAQEGAAMGAQPQEAGGSMLRQNLGNRLYPQDSMVVAGLRRAY